MRDRGLPRRRLPRQEPGGPAAPGPGDLERQRHQRRLAERRVHLRRPGRAPWTWDQLAEATARHGLPWIAKGILTAEAAEAAIGAGAAAILVSNHGGRQVDPAPASLDMLPEVAAQVGGRVPVLLDSGVRTGADVFLALALGASAVVIGRLAAYGLAAAGERGVRRAIELLTEELHILMTLAGVPDIASLTSETVARRHRV